MTRLVLLYDEITVRYCMKNCKCPLTDQDLVTFELEERMFEMGISRISRSADSPTNGVDRLDGDNSDDEDDITSYVLRQGLGIQCGPSSNSTNFVVAGSGLGISLPRPRTNPTSSRSPIQRCVKVTQRPVGRVSPPLAILMRPAPKSFRAQNMLGG